MKPYYADGTVQLYCGDMREVLPALDIQADAAIVDPPYGETSLKWDRWPEGWPSLMAQHTSRMWCFGTLAMFMEHAGDFEMWRRPRSAIWQKRNGTGFDTTFFKVIHEQMGYFYRGPWTEAHESALREDYHGPDKHARARTSRTPHTGAIGAHNYEDDGRRLIRSILEAPSVRGGIHPTQKPEAILDPLIRYSSPIDGLVLDPFAGSGSTLLTARTLGRRAIGVEVSEAYCEAAARRLDVPDLFGGAA